MQFCPDRHISSNEIGLWTKHYSQSQVLSNACFLFEGLASDGVFLLNRALFTTANSIAFLKHRALWTTPCLHFWQVSID